MPLSPVLHQAIMDAIRQAGAFARQEFLQFSAEHIEYKGKNDLFSYVDVQTERMLEASLGALVPGAGFLNEEGGAREGDGDYVWIIDPIDGTTNFIHGMPLFSISVALQHQGQVVAGYIYSVMADELFAALRGGGATLNGNPISVSGTRKLADSLLATGFPYREFSWIQDYIRMFTEFMQRSHGLRRLGSAAIDLAFVACGRLEGFFEFGLNPWDVAAGGLIVSEAGGKVTDFNGGDGYVFGRQLLASNGHIHREMYEVIQSRIGDRLSERAT